MISYVRHGLNHWRRTAKQELHVLGRCGAVFLDHIGSNEADATSPAGRGVVQDVVDVEVVMLGCEFIEFLLEQNIFFVDVSKDEVDNGSVSGVSANSTDYLIG